MTTGLRRLRSPRLVRLSRFELLALIGLAAWACGPLALMLVHAASTSDVFTGADGAFAADQLQYLSWIRDSGTHALVANEFAIAPQHFVYLNPMFLISGALWRVGAGLALSLLLWKPVAIIVLFAGIVAYMRRMVADPGGRAAAVTIALCFGTPATALFDWAHAGSAGLRRGLASLSGELFPAGSLWGYAPTVIGVGLMPIFVLGVERILLMPSGASRKLSFWTTAGTALAGGLASWVHPWQGETLALLAAMACVWSRFDRRCVRLALPLAMTLAPLLYYYALSHYDLAWSTARAQDLAPRLPLDVLLLGLAPLAALALAGVQRPRELADRLLLLWVAAALAAYFVFSPSEPVHALAGLGIPLAVLMVRAWSHLRASRTAAFVAVGALVIPGLVFTAAKQRDYVAARSQPTYLRAGEDAALTYLNGDHAPGGVLTTVYLGSAVPAFTGRQVWAGHPAWTPDWVPRARLADALFDGRLGAVEASELVRASQARFLVSDCHANFDLMRELAPQLLIAKRQFGCAAVYTVR